MLAACPLSIVPVRREPSDRAEMVTQWLFGETADVIEKQDKWTRLRFHHDGYEGWVDNKQLEHADARSPVNAPRCIVASLEYDLGGATLVLPMGAIVRVPERVEGVIPIQAGLDLEGCTTRDLSGPASVKALLMTRAFLGAPYLWGGRTPWGVDCSGFIQMVHLLAGVPLPRDAWQQAGIGTPVQRSSDVRTGDLAFFSNTEGRVVHVGYVLNEEGTPHIMHASGRVRVDRLTEDGILDVREGRITHRLCGLRRLE